MGVVKRDVTSLSKSGSAKLKGDVTLSEGTGVSITQTGQDIEIAASGGSGSGDVVGPASSSDNAIARFDLTTGKLIQDSAVLIADLPGASEAAIDVTLNAAAISDANYLNFPADTRVGGSQMVSTDNTVTMTNKRLTSPKLNENVAITATATEVNVLDGITPTTTELNYVDGVTSAIQTQLNNKQPLDADLTALAAANNSSVLAATTASFLTADETKLDGIEAGADVTDATNVNAAGATMNADTTLAGNGYFLDEDNMASNDATKVPSQQSVKAYVDAALDAAGLADHPIGKLEFGPNSGANPNTYLRGCASTTWARIEGRFIVGVSDSDSDFDVNDTGGAKTVTLTAAQSGVPAHSHGITDPGHNHTIDRELYPQGTSTNRQHPSGSTSTANTSTNTTGITINNNTPADAASAHQNLPPFLAKYVWQRTA